VNAFRRLTFLTDYGLADAFVAVCHGVASQIASDLRIIDITHLIPPGDVRRGAVVLAQAALYLPRSVHVAVVDPGVGTTRRAVAAAAGGSIFVGPDNGVISVALAAAGGATLAVELTNRALWRDGGAPLAATFHGRDIFMPVAARLAAGLPLAEAGRELDPASLVTLERPASLLREGGADAEAVTVDRFGNVQLSLTASDAAAAGLVPPAMVRLGWNGNAATVPVRATFGDVGPGEPVVYIDSDGQLAIAVNGGDAAARLGLRPGSRVTLDGTEQ
jgi:S-adenosyl-L-methionine hydrolase (adenosine-forming)